MRRGFDPSDPPEPAQALRPQTFGFVGILSDHILELVRLFKSADRATLSSVLREEAGLPWARAFDGAWEADEREGRWRGLFDLVWHRRAMDRDPRVSASVSDFEALLDVVHEDAPQLAALLAFVDPNNSANRRRHSGPEWWRAWHEAAATRPGGWLDLDEVRFVARSWSSVRTTEADAGSLDLVEQIYAPAGTSSLPMDLGGFFAQCSCESRVVVVEVDS